MKCPLRTTFFAATLTLIAAASQAQVYIANLSGPAESPANNSPGIGQALVTLNPAANTMRVQVSFSNLTAGTTASHIHSATAVPLTGTANVATQVPSFVGFPLGVTSGTFDNTLDMSLASSYNPAFVMANGGTPLGAETALFSSINSGTAYLNIHTTAFNSGEIRGFLVRAVPETGAVGLLSGLTVCGALFLLRRRR